MVGASRTQQDELELSEAVVRTASGGTSSSHDVDVGMILVRKLVSKIGGSEGTAQGGLFGND